MNVPTVHHRNNVWIRCAAIGALARKHRRAQTGTVIAKREFHESLNHGLAVAAHTLHDVEALLPVQPFQTRRKQRQHIFPQNRIRVDLREELRDRLLFGRRRIVRFVLDRTHFAIIIAHLERDVVFGPTRTEYDAGFTAAIIRVPVLEFQDAVRQTQRVRIRVQFLDKLRILKLLLAFAHDAFLERRHFQVALDFA